ncbi:MAG: hypothetical protein AB7V61_16000 [Methylocystis sp.]
MSVDRLLEEIERDGHLGALADHMEEKDYPSDLCDAVRHARLETDNSRRAREMLERKIAAKAFYIELGRGIPAENRLQLAADKFNLHVEVLRNFVNKGDPALRQKPRRIFSGSDAA